MVGFPNIHGVFLLKMISTWGNIGGTTIFKETTVMHLYFLETSDLRRFEDSWKYLCWKKSSINFTPQSSNQQSSWL